ncbi:MAG TPA: urate oxidase, partial [Kribbella sp.]|nr:urate oxidase [Kribbella sp.]
DWDKSYDAIKALLLSRFATIHSLALQQSLYGMGSAVLEQHPEVAEIKFSAPNKHHFLVDLSPFGVENPGEVFVAADRPYGLIEATVTRDDASDAGSAWVNIAGFC